METNNQNTFLTFIRNSNNKRRQKMKSKKLLVTIALVTGLLFFWIPLALASPQIIPFDSDRWQFMAKEHRLEDFRGQKSLFLSQGFALLKDSNDFVDGIIEFDIAIPPKRGFSGAVWRLKDKNNYEEFYMRHHQSGNEDANQYSPVFGGLASWQLYYAGDGYGYPVRYRFNEWMHVKVVVAGNEAEIYLDDMETPIVYVSELKRKTEPGMVGLRGQMFAPAHYANFSLTKQPNPPIKRVTKKVKYPPGPIGRMAAMAKKKRGAVGPPHPGTVTTWQVSSPFNAKSLNGILRLKDAELGSLSWSELPSDGTGLANLSRLVTAKRLRAGDNCMLAKFSLDAEKAAMVPLEFGFSDAARLFVNGQLLYAGNDGYSSRDYRFLGTIGYFDTLYLPMAKGRNEIIIAVSENFGGWGVRARIKETEGIKLAKAYTPKQGKVLVKEISGVKFHTYTAMGMVSHIIETQNELIMQDTVQNGPHNKELKQYVDSLNKPLGRIIISHEHAHHWVGLEMFQGVPIYANAETIKSIREKGELELQGLKKQFGEEAIPYTEVIIPSFYIHPGEERIDGVLFQYSKPAPKMLGNVLWINMPDQKVLIHHHLAYLGMHFPPPPISARIDMLKSLQEKNYNWILAGHGMPAGPEFFDKTIEYFNTAQSIIDESTDAKSAKEKLVRAYPKYGGAFLLDMMLPAHYKKR
jgi:hypothetical protein